MKKGDLNDEKLDCGWTEAGVIVKHVHLKREQTIKRVDHHSVKRVWRELGVMQSV